MNKPVLPFVETMITQVCNLSCVGCTNYSDLQHEGYLTWEQGKEQIEPWLERIDILDFGILGGEPTVNPEVNNWILGLRELLPNAQIRFTTNGLLLRKNLEIIHNLANIGNCVFKIAVHQENEDLENLINEIFAMYDWEPVVEYGVSRFKTKNNFRFHVKRPNIFWKTFKGDYTSMRPHNSIPSDAFSICCQQTCPLLFEGKLFKCSTSALLEDTLKKFNFPYYEEWKPFIQNGLSPQCLDTELDKFLKNFGKPNEICRQCPSSADIESKIIHIENVSRKKIQWK